MRQRFLLPLCLAVLLAARPLTMAAAPPRSARAPAWAFVRQLAGPHKASLGGHDAVSTATTSVNGPFTINGTQGKALPSTRLTTTGHVAGSWSASPNPVAPGLSMSSSGFISGKPTVAGTFTSVITAWEFNLSGPSASATFTFQIAGAGTPPAVVAGPASQTLSAGTNATLSVTATGTAPLGYIWKFAGTNIPAATNSTLVLSDIQPSQSGSYTATITNPFGSVSTNATLMVEIPPVITNQPQDQIVLAGSAVSFTAGAVGRPLAWQWWYNSNLVAGATNPILALAGTTTNESGFYAVVASNAVGVAASAQARLLVAPAPTGEAPVLTLGGPDPSRLFLSFATVAGYNYTVESSDALPAAVWTTVTNLPAAFSGANLSVPQSATSAPRRFYRVTFQGN